MVDFVTSSTGMSGTRTTPFDGSKISSQANCASAVDGSPSKPPRRLPRPQRFLVSHREPLFLLGVRRKPLDCSDRSKDGSTDHLVFALGELTGNILLCMGQIKEER